MQTTFTKSAIRSTLPRLEDPLPLEEAEYETSWWFTPSLYLNVDRELNYTVHTQDLNALSCTEPVSVSANKVWDNYGRVMEPGAPLEHKRKSEDLCYPKEDVQFYIDKNSDCDAEYSEEEEQEEEAPPPKKARTNKTFVANDEALHCLPSPPLDHASLRTEFLASLVKWPADLRSTATSRKHFLATDPSVDHSAALDPKKVMCSGCKEYRTLDMRHQYYLTHWFAHRRRCSMLFNKWLVSRYEC
ncbi:hypothetical protein CPB85DRAFT_1564512 [Mucidula mucida]|nr:hypothetical protein CPB85DRAFT_1564512 [Mucidula mucida]